MDARRVRYLLRYRLGGLARLAGWGRNPLRRITDRIELVARVVAVLLVAAALPLALMVGGAVQRYSVDEVNQQNAARHQVTAVLAVDSPEHPGVTTLVSTTATWQAPDGTTVSGPITVASGTTKGSTVPIWVNNAGDQVLPPLTSDQVYWRWFATVSAVMGLAAIAALVSLGALRWYLDRKRWADWDHEWANVEPQWTRHLS